MAEDSDLEKTEPASPRRLEQAREEGDVPRSRELATCTVLLATGAGLWFSGDNLVREMNHMLASGLAFEREQAFDFDLLAMQLGKNLANLLVAFAPLALLLMVAAIASPLLIGGWLFSGKALQPNFGRLNPLKGMGNLISSRSGVELIKAIAKAVLVGTVSWLVVSSQMDAMLALTVDPLKTGSAHLASLLLTAFISIVSSLVVIALMDAPYQMWHYANKLKMTREEVRQEAKESDGDPHVKAKIRQLQREMAKCRPRTWWLPTQRTMRWRSNTRTGRCGRQLSWLKVRMKSLPKFVNSPPNTMCRCWKRRHWPVLCTVTPSWAMRFPKACTRRLQKYWPTYSSYVRIKQMAARVLKFLLIWRCRRNLIRSILPRSRKLIMG
jgi:flagellar biosynthesis protein FlhB